MSRRKYRQSNMHVVWFVSSGRPGLYHWFSRPRYSGQDSGNYRKGLIALDKSVYSALNQCPITGLERPVKSLTFPQGPCVRLYRDHVGRHRIVAFKSDAHRQGYSGLIVLPCGKVYYKETCPSMRGWRTTRQLQAILTVWGVHWYPSEWQTKAGRASYVNV